MQSNIYFLDHKDLGLLKVVHQIWVYQQTLSRWKKELQETSDIECSGSGNFSDEEKEIAKLKRELRDTQDALDVLKKPSAFGK